MTVISSAATPLYKKTLPKVIYGGLGLISVVAVLAAAMQGDPWLLGFPIVALGSAVVLVRMRLRPLADRVQDGGDHLLVLRDGVEMPIALSAIQHVSVVTRSNFIRLQLAGTSAFGRELSFVAYDRRASPVAADLQRRVAHAAGRGAP